MEKHQEVLHIDQEHSADGIRAVKMDFILHRSVLLFYTRTSTFEQHEATTSSCSSLQLHKGSQICSKTDEQNKGPARNPTDH